MSRTGRLVIDRVKRALSSYLRFPVPPYGKPNYWEHCYRSLGPEDWREWAQIGYQHLSEYRYKLVPLSAEQRLAWGIANNQNNKKTIATDNTRDDNNDDTVTDYINTTWGETLQAHPQAGSDEPILIIGCGNSRLGESMVDAQWRGPIVQVDVSSRLVDSMSIRNAADIESGHQQIVQDDATLLSAIADAKVYAVIDKGLLDALFCADEYQQVADCLQAAHRVLIPGGIFVTFSFSQPQFLMPRLLPTTGNRRRRSLQWHSVQVRQLDSIYLYRFQKALRETMHHPADKNRHRTR